MAWDNNAERKEHTRESAEVTISLDKEELEKIAAFAELDVDTMSVEDLAEALHGIVAEMEAPEQEQTVSKEEVIAWGKETLSDLTNGTNQLVITPSGYDDFISSSTILNAFQEYSGSKRKSYDQKTRLFQTTCTMKFRIPCLIMLHIWKKNLHHR